MQEVAIIIGLYTLSSKLPWLPPMVMAVWLPMTRQQTIVIASACVGLTFPGMMEEPGSLAGSASSPRPQRPRTEPADVVGDLHQRSREGVEGSRSSDDGIVGRQLGELVRCGDEGQTGRFGDGAATRSAKSGCVFRPVPGGAAERQLVQVLDREGEAAQVCVKLGHPAPGFLTEGERHGVHEVGPVDLDDARPGLGLGRQRVTQGGHGGNDLVDDGFQPRRCASR